MNKEKQQIEEMAKVMCGGCADGKECMQCLCADWYRAEKLYNAGYRKQEWISVEERLQAEKDALIKNYAECMKDYASEIFAEIEKHLIFNAYGIATISDKTFAELKKKYTEGYDGRV